MSKKFCAIHGITENNVKKCQLGGENRCYIARKHGQHNHESSPSLQLQRQHDRKTHRLSNYMNVQESSSIFQIKDIQHNYI